MHIHLLDFSPNIKAKVQNKNQENAKKKLNSKNTRKQKNKQMNKKLNKRKHCLSLMYFHLHENHIKCSVGKREWKASEIKKPRTKTCRNETKQYKWVQSCRQLDVESLCAWNLRVFAYQFGSLCVCQLTTSKIENIFGFRSHHDRNRSFKTIWKYATENRPTIFRLWMATGRCSRLYCCFFSVNLAVAVVVRKNFSCAKTKNVHL